jgi:Transcriptional regulatory protein, C terminal
MATVWGTDFSGNSRAADMQIRNIREKIEPDPRNPRYVLTARGRATSSPKFRPLRIPVAPVLAMPFGSSRYYINLGTLRLSHEYVTFAGYLGVLTASRGFCESHSMTSSAFSLGGNTG